ncbi:MAG: sensor histidine kinase, partial [Terrimesophilobacter sp.]
MTDSAQSAAPLTPIFLGLRICLHTLITLLTGFVIVRALTAPQPRASWIVALALLFLAFYILGAILARTGVSRVGQLGWLLVLSVLALVLAALSPDAAFLVFPLFFLQLHLLSTRWGIGAV